VIEGDADLAREWPLAEAGLNVTWTDDLTPYRTLKVRLLNGAHTLMVAPALLAGLDTVRQSVEDPLVGQLVRQSLFEEIVPTLDLPPAEATAFAREVLNRFRNPYVAHRLTSIALNGISKWRVRVLPSLEAYLARRRRLPEALTFSLAALVALYRGAVAADGVLVGRAAGRAYGIRDEADVLAFLARAWSDYDHVHDVGGLCRSLLGSERLWGRDLNEPPGLTERVTGHLDMILQAGMVPAIQQVLQADR
jgi:tagaturonate reductase